MTVISAWWRLNIRFKDPVGDRVGVELLFNSVEFGSQRSCQQTPRGLETRCGREGHTRPRGLSESPDGVDPNIRRTIKTQRDGHNSGVKIWSLCSVSSILSHETLKQPFQTLAIKWEVNIFLKKSFLRLYHAFSFLRLPSCVLYSCVFLRASVSIIESLWYSKWVYNNMSSGLLPEFVELWNLHGPSNYVLYWIRGSRLFWFR